MSDFDDAFQQVQQQPPSAPPPPNPYAWRQNRKPSKAKWWLIGIGGVMLIGAIGNIIDPKPRERKPPEAPSVPPIAAYRAFEQRLLAAVESCDSGLREVAPILSSTTMDTRAQAYILVGKVKQECAAAQSALASLSSKVPNELPDKVRKDLKEATQKAWSANRRKVAFLDEVRSYLDQPRPSTAEKAATASDEAKRFAVAIGLHLASARTAMGIRE